MPSTWRLYSQDVYGEVVEQTPQKERYVAYKMIEKWLANGETARQIALRWNQGHTGPCKSGINKLGVKYDSCTYAQKVLAYMR